MKFSKVTALLLALLMASAQFGVSARAQDLTSDETKKPETAKVTVFLALFVATKRRHYMEDLS